MGNFLLISNEHTVYFYRIISRQELLFITYFYLLDIEINNIDIYE